MKKAILIILDGWGHGKKNASNAIYQANTPFIDSLYNKYPNKELILAARENPIQMSNKKVPE